MISRAWTLLEEGQARDAIHVFGRVLLWDPAHEEARRGLRTARAAVREADRALDARLDEAAQALEAGDLGTARRVIGDVLDRVGDGDRALTLLERTDTREGRLAEAGPSTDVRATPEWRQGGRQGPAAWRLTLAASWAAVLTGLTLAVVSSWERLVLRLTDAPSPRHEVSLSEIVGSPLSKGEAAMADARRRLEADDPAGALTALAHVPPEEPLYPLAVQLRQQAEGALKRGGGPSH